MNRQNDQKNYISGTRERIIMTDRILPGFQKKNKKN